jgi:hypothetical protein
MSGPKTHYQYYFRLFVDVILVIFITGALIYTVQFSFDWLKEKIDPAFFRNIVYLLTGKDTDKIPAKTAPVVPAEIKFVDGEGKVKISGSRPAGAGQPAEIDLAVSLGKNEAVNLSGWMLRSDRGIFYLPVAVERFDPVNYSSPQAVVVKGSAKVKIYFAESHLGFGLRLNKCTGYLESLYHFSPALPKNCPIVSAEPAADNLTSVCRRYLDSLGICSYPSADPSILPADPICREFLNGVNYEGCFNRHKNDPDFLSSEWRLYMPGLTDFLAGHGKVELLNSGGESISSRSY